VAADEPSIDRAAARPPDSSGRSAPQQLLPLLQEDLDLPSQILTDVTVRGASDTSGPCCQWPHAKGAGEGAAMLPLLATATRGRPSAPRRTPWYGGGKE